MILGYQLMIGDWVLVDGTPRKVEAITKKKIGYHRKENEPRLYYARLHDIEPIPIDEALVLKLGFTKRYFPYLMDDYYIHALYDIKSAKNRFSITNMDLPNLKKEDISLLQQIIVIGQRCR